MSSSSPSRLELPGRGTPLVMAHRGASDLAPENGATAIRLALEHGADLIETDLWFSADDEIICHHDPTLERMTGDPRPIVDTVADEICALPLKNLDGRPGDDRILRLRELLALVPADVPVMLEIKDPRFREPKRAAALGEIIRPRVETQRVGILAFDLSLVRAIRDQIPGLVAGHIARFSPFPTTTCELLGPFYPLLWINPLYVRMAQRRGQKVCPLDPHLHDHLPRYLRMGVDAVLTNDPRKTRALIERLAGPEPPGDTDNY